MFDIFYYICGMKVFVRIMLCLLVGLAIGWVIANFWTVVGVILFVLFILGLLSLMYSLTKHSF